MNLDEYKIVPIVWPKDYLTIGMGIMSGIIFLIKLHTTYDYILFAGFVAGFMILAKTKQHDVLNMFGGFIIGLWLPVIISFFK